MSCPQKVEHNGAVAHRSARRANPIDAITYRPGGCNEMFCHRQRSGAIGGVPRRLPNLRQTESGARQPMVEIQIEFFVARNEVKVGHRGPCFFDIIGAGFGVAFTTAVGTVVAELVPDALVAMTRTRSVLSASTLFSTYVFPVAPEIAAQLPPVESQRSHTYLNVGDPVQVPGSTVSVDPS